MNDEKFPKTEEELIYELLQIVNELGWETAIPEVSEGTQEIPGMAIGNPAFLKDLQKSCPDVGFEIYQDLDVTSHEAKKKKESMH